MPAVSRLGDMCSGHGCFPPRAATGGSSSVLINGKPAHRQGDAWETHCCSGVCHDSIMGGGSSRVYVNGRALARVGDSVECGSTVATGSPNVSTGG